MKKKDTTTENSTSLISDITVDLNDGWADDVALVYPEGGWRPDEEELTQIPMDTPSKKRKKGRKRKTKEANASHPVATKEVVTDPTLEASPRRLSPFRTFLIVWLGILSIAIAAGLGLFYKFLEDYEATYQASRPYHQMEQVLQTLEAGNLDEIMLMMNWAPELNAFESQEQAKASLQELLEGQQFSYQETGNYLEDLPEYYVLMGDYILSTVTLRKNPNEQLAYGFPTWYISSFDFQLEPSHTCQIQAPENVTVRINDIPLTADYETGLTKELEEASYYEEVKELPVIKQYLCTGFFQTPVITATNVFGQEVPVQFNNATGQYEIGFGSCSPEEQQALEDLTIELASLYANCVSQDASVTELKPYFVPDATIYQFVKHACEHQYFSPHTAPEIKDQEILRFVPFDQESFLCQVSLNQYMTVYYQEQVVNTNLTFFFLKTEEGYQCYNMQF